MDCNISPIALEIDPSSVLAVEFNNQASINTDSQCDEILDKDYPEYSTSQDMVLEDTWTDDVSLNAPSRSNLPIPLPPPSGFDDFPLCEESDTALSLGSLKALFSRNDSDSSPVNDTAVAGAEPGVCGLRNLGNTCFMSTGLQCLIATSALVHYFLQKNVTLSLDSMKDTLAVQFSVLVEKVWSGQYSVIHPIEFKQTLGAHYPQFKDYRQHDCQEFLALLLDGLHEQLNVASGKALVEEGNNACPSSSSLSPQNVPETVSSAPKSPSYVNCNNEVDPEVEKIEGETCEVGGDAGCDINNVVESQLVKNCNVENEQTLKISKINNCKQEVSMQRGPRGCPKTAKDVLNNAQSPRLTGYEDIMKDAKTSNVNVLVTKPEANNEIRFDSEKFPRHEKFRGRDSINFNTFQVYENNTNGKRGKSTMTYFNSVSDTDGLDFKRIKMNDSSSVSNLLDKNHQLECERKVDINLLEKNVRIEEERKKKLINSSMAVDSILMDDESSEDTNYDEGTMNGDSKAVSLGEAARDPGVEDEADEHWEKHLAKNRSIIVDTFQGQFKSTVVCSACQFVSVTYEPFMYLSVPLPHAMERQLYVTFVPAKSHEPVEYLLTLNKQDRVANIKEHLLKLLDEPVASQLMVAEVLDNHIAKILDDVYLIRYVDDINRKLYIFELVVQQLNSNLFGDDGATSNPSIEGFGDCEDLAENVTCTICLEEKDTNIKQHVDCSCFLCNDCTKHLRTHNDEDQLKCPVCQAVISPEIDMVPVKHCSSKSSFRLLNIPVVFRLDKVGDGNNNQKTVELFGHPCLLRLYNRLQATDLYEIVASRFNYSQPFKLLLVDGQGRRCSRCMYNAHCRGCVIPKEGPVILRSDDNIAITFSSPVPVTPPSKHPSTVALRPNQPLTLHDCVRAFSQSEILDEHNPWYCPKCQKNQCATKTLTVWRYPDYLIVYLKRFVFHECSSMKLEDKVIFPLCGMKLDQCCDSLYDLYACVCHNGGVTAGHYTAYTQHLQTSEWHYFNDASFNKQKPQEEDFSNAYVLFYKKQGVGEELYLDNASDCLFS
nr:PREDICTED: ubiquitin carboxyl-terminal hydrolase 15-like [Bemisia tabaci]